MIDRLHAVNTRAIDLTEALLLLSRADQRSFTREHVDLSLIAEEATETLLPLQKSTASPSRPPAMTPTIGSHALLLQLTTNLVHNAIVHNLPEQGTVWVTTSVHPKTCGAHRREHRREAQPTIGFHACRAVSARHRTHHAPTTQVSASVWQSSRASPKRTTEPSPSPPALRAGSRHGATARRTTAHGQMTIRELPHAPKKAGL